MDADQSEEITELERLVRAVPMRSGAWLDLRIVARDVAEHLHAEGCRLVAQRTPRQTPERRLAVPDQMLGGWSQPCRVDETERGE